MKYEKLPVSKLFQILFFAVFVSFSLFSCKDSSSNDDSNSGTENSSSTSLYNPFYDFVDVGVGTSVQGSEAKKDANGSNIWTYYSDSACTKALSLEEVKALLNTAIVYKISVAITGAEAKSDKSGTQYFIDSACTLKATISESTGDNEVFYKKTLETKTAISVSGAANGVTANSAHSYDVNSTLKSVDFIYNGDVAYNPLRIIITKGELVIVPLSNFNGKTYTFEMNSYLTGKYVATVYGKYKGYTYSYPILLVIKDP